jgi:hypothetical protein
MDQSHKRQKKPLFPPLLNQSHFSKQVVSNPVILSADTTQEFNAAQRIAKWKIKGGLGTPL